MCGCGCFLGGNSSDYIFVYVKPQICKPATNVPYLKQIRVLFSLATSSSTSND